MERLDKRRQIVVQICNFEEIEEHPATKKFENLYYTVFLDYKANFKQDNRIIRITKDDIFYLSVQIGTRTIDIFCCMYDLAISSLNTVYTSESSTCNLTKDFVFLEIKRRQQPYAWAISVIRKVFFRMSL